MNTEKYSRQMNFSTYDFIQGMTFVKDAKDIIEQIELKGLDKNCFRMRDLNVVDGKNTYRFIGGKPSAVEWRGFISGIKQNKEIVEIPSIWAYEDKSGKTKHSNYAPSTWRGYTNVRVLETRKVESSYWTYSLNLDVYKETVEYIKDYMNDFILAN